MAGITNTAFRRLSAEYGGGLYVSEMITSRALVEENPTTMRLIQFHESETPRSIQLYGVEPESLARAAIMIRERNLADHIDMNFGCPVPKVTRKGGGAALPWKLDLFREIVNSTVKAAEHIPVTVKMRKGIDEDHITYLDAAKIAEDAGVAAIALHARTAAQHYSGFADWAAITKLKQTITGIPVLGNGDIWSAEDALRMMAETGCDGVVVGRGCLGRPWLFHDLESGFTGSDSRIRANLADVATAIARHARLLGEFFGTDDDGGEFRACRDIRKHISWYLKGYPVGGELRTALAKVSSYAELDDLLGKLDLSAEYPGADAEGPRGRAGTPKKPHLPDRWLESRNLAQDEKANLVETEYDTSGG
ncbi:MAG: tRNA dihydrouridine synthase DusB [Microbacteriaceae bacterium]|nr:tRNA dihydrouridine synthase DusB [Microbacteriaceae bacterium]